MKKIPFSLPKMPVLRLRSFFLCPSRIGFAYAALLMGMLALHSCGSTRKETEAEYTSSNEHEGGASAIKNKAKAGAKVGVAIVAKAAGASSTHNSADRDDNDHFSPMDDGGLAFRTELAFVQKGSKNDDSKVTLNYLEVTEDLIFEHKFENNGSLYGGIGPYIGYGIGGKAGNGSFKVNSFGGDGYKRFDAGLNLMGGYRLPSGLFFMLGYDFGLVNKSPASDFSSKNRSFQLGVGYSFDKLTGGGKKK